jgi:hypothetical protein
MKTESSATRAAITLLAGLVIAAVATLCVISYMLGGGRASAQIYKAQKDRLARENAGLMALVGVVDQAKAREFASCVQTGKTDCESVIAITPVSP